MAVFKLAYPLSFSLSMATMDWSKPVSNSSKPSKPVEAVRAKDKMNPACDAVAVRVETMIKPVVVTRRLEKLRIIMLNPRQTMRWVGNQRYVSVTQANHFAYLPIQKALFSDPRPRKRPLHAT